MTLLNPYLSRNFLWLRGNLHTHTTVSDGVASPEEVIAAYEQKGYDFLAISDHDAFVPPGDYQALTKMTLIPADEVSRHGPHILAVQIREVVPPDADRQKVIDVTNAQGGFAILNHPNWQKHFNHFPQELMEQLTGYVGIEIYNGVIERLEGSALATDRWDRLLSSGRRVWGYAHDDSHRPGDLARGWNVVQAADRSVNAICDALRHGRFYASTGVTITRIEVRDHTLFIAAPNAQRIRFLGAWGKEFRYVDANEAEYKVTGDEGGYVRVECFGAGVQAAWTQPFYFEG
ncbi:MAG: CehA/McbA family metallohydrolase [Abditibacteriales bacterium]|nr:CehA/McbA family metallohydrolase [Abditibacteriales bacterium]MDW8367629.1 CehA/McbA family metallohydrolase [Abditibacteriales bacterium]